MPSDEPTTQAPAPPPRALPVRSLPSWMAAAGLAFAAALGLYLTWLLPLDRLPTACVTRRITGVPCPTCGIGRSLHALLHGRIGESWHYHPLLIVFGVLGSLWVAGVVAPARARGRRVSVALKWGATALALALLIGVWAYRLTHGGID